VGLSEQAALHLAETRVRVVGVDYLSVGGYHADGARIHKILLEAGIWIIEGLDLSPVTGGRYEMICLPVKLHGSDGAPARAILRPLSGPGSGDRNELRHRRDGQAGLIRHRARVALDTGTGLVPGGGRAELAGQVHGSQHAGPQGRRR
jgi:hypothetical protein